MSEEIKKEINIEKKEKDLRDDFINGIRKEETKGTRHFYMGG